MPDLGPMGRGGARRRTRRRMAAANTARSAPPPQTPAPEQTEASEEVPAYIGELEELARLRDQGVISAEDFEAKKRQLLGL